MKASDMNERILDRMRRLCSMREYCTSDIEGKIIAALKKRRQPQGDCPPEEMHKTVQDMMEQLRKDGYVDDKRYARAYVRDKSALSGWGRFKIARALSAKGIDSETASSAMKELDDGRAKEKMRKVLELKAASLAKSEDGMTLRQKLLRFALGRGYSYGEAAAAIDEIFSENKYL